MRFLFIAFIVVPILEMWVLIKVGAVIGASWTILLVLLTAVVGSIILRQQGLSTLLRAQQRLQDGQLPAREIIEGLVLAVSGALLLTPGFVTDAWGFLGLLPLTRKAMVHWLLKKTGPSGFQFYTSSDITGFRPGRKNAPDNSNNSIEGEFWEDK